MWSESPLERVAVAVVPMVVSITLHEVAHAFAADRLGDPTPRERGRLTLNPLAHVDLIGTLIVPSLSAFVWGFALIGWGQHTPIRADRFPGGRPWLRLAAASAAGPLANAALAVIATAVLFVLHRRGMYGGDDIVQSGALFPLIVRRVLAINVVLAIFHLFPVPRLDGARVLPAWIRDSTNRLERYAPVVLAAFALFPPLSLLVYVPANLVLDGAFAALGLPKLLD
jgi:Zn-dependent protease